MGDQETILRRRPAAYLTYKYPEQGPEVGKTLFSEHVSHSKLQEQNESFMATKFNLFLIFYQIPRLLLFPPLCLPL